MQFQSITPKKLKRGDHLRVVAPSRSLSIISEEVRRVATDRLMSRGYRVSFGKNVEETDDFLSSSVDSRVSDLHDAFSNKDVDGIITAIGGYNSIQLLQKLDFNLIKENPKILMGFSDITTLSNAILSRTGLITYSGPHYSSWGMKEGFEYTENAFEKAVENTDPYTLALSESWSDDLWFLNQKDRKHIKNDSDHIISRGQATGRVIGGNLSSLVILNGTSYMPDIEDSILFIEDDEEASVEQFDRMFQSLMLQSNARSIRGIMVGRFQKNTKMNKQLLEKIILPKLFDRNIPVAYNLNFGHTIPIGVIPIGGVCGIDISAKGVNIVFERH